jgi:hypothetical protein
MQPLGVGKYLDMEKWQGSEVKDQHIKLLEIFIVS